MPVGTAAFGEIPATIWTVGHSTRPGGQFLDMLRNNNIGTVADVRRCPASQRYPHFNRKPLSIAGLLRSLGTRVLHIVSATEPEEHPWTAAARLDEGVLTYDSRRGEPAARLQLPSQQASLL